MPKQSDTTSNSVSNSDATVIVQGRDFNGPVHLGSGDQINGLQINGNNTVVVTGNKTADQR